MFKIKDGLSLGANTVIDASGNITVPGKTTLSNTTASAASLNLGTGTADPTTPASGDIWNNAGTLKFYGATTKTLAYTDSNISGTASNIAGAGIVAVANGGTNTSTTPTAGAVSYGNGSAYAFTSVGTSGQVLTSAGASVPTWTTATDANTFNAIVRRDSSGNFSAGTITASLSGTATNASNLAVTDDTATNTTYYPSFALTTSGNAALRVSSTKLTFNPGTGLLTSTGFSGSGASLTSLSAGNISTGTLAIARGGTAGSAAPTAGAIAYGNGTAYAFTAAGTTGQVLTSAGAGVPTWTTQSSLSVGTATNSTNSTNASNVAITSETASAADHYVHFGAATTGNDPVKVSSSGIKFQPSTGNLTVGGALTVGGNLTVGGTTTIVNSTTISVDDPIFTLGGDTAPTVDDNKDRGIEFRWHNGTTAKVGFFGYDDSTGKFTFVPDATNTSEVFSGTKGTIDANLEWADVLNKPDPVVTVTLTGDVSGTANTTLTDLASGTVTVTTTIEPNSVALGADTTGNYVASIADAAPGVQTGTSGLTISAAAGEGTAATIAHADTSTLSGQQGTAGVSSVTVDGFGHVTGVTTATYLTAEADTLSSVTGRGATTSTASTFSGGLTVGGTGIVYNGSTSGSTTFRASAAAGATTITLPATTGTVVTTGDSGTVTSTMIANGTIVNDDINASAGIAITKLAASTISGVSLGNNLNTLTIGSGLSGTSYNGSGAVTIAVDSTVALRADTHFIGTTSVALNRASANLALTGISSITLPGSTSGTVLLQPAATAGTTTITLPATTGTVALSTGTLGQFASTTSADLAGVISDETGTGALVFASSPSLTTPAIGAATGISLTVRPAATQDAVILAGRAGGTSSFGVTISPTTLTASRTVTLPDGNVTLAAGTMAVTGGKLNQFASTSSTELAGVISDETGTGALVFATNPVLVTPALGTPSSGNFSTGTFTWPTFNQNTSGTAAGLSSTLVATSGGTGHSSYAIGDILYASTTSALSKLAGVATGNALISGGVGAAPSWGKIGLTTHISGTLAVANGGTGSTTASDARTALGGTAVGVNFFTLTNPSAITFPRINADNTISALSAADFRTAIGAGTSSTVGTVTNVSGTAPISVTNGTSTPSITISAATQLAAGSMSATDKTKLDGIASGATANTGTVTSITASTTAVSGLSLSGGAITTSGTIGITGTLSVTPSNFASQTANTFLAAPNGAAGAPTFRAIVAADLPTVTTATNANNINISATTSTDTICSVVLVADQATGNQSPFIDNGLTYNASTNVLAATVSTANALNTANSYTMAGLTVNGDISATGNITAYSSDSRLKTNVVAIPNALEKMQQIGGYSFDWDIEKCESIGFKPENRHEHGVLAQEIQQVLPDVVVQAAFDEDYLTVRYERIVPLLIEAIKELNDKVNSLQDQLNSK